MTLFATLGPDAFRRAKGLKNLPATEAVGRIKLLVVSWFDG